MRNYGCSEWTFRVNDRRVRTLTANRQILARFKKKFDYKLLHTCDYAEHPTCWLAVVSRQVLMVYCYIHPEQKVLILTMLQNGVKPSLIAAQTGYSVDVVRRVQRISNETGHVSRRRTGSPRALTSLEVSVS